ncbi:MAG: HD domain-containing protein [Dehalococcoidales bacterium]|nr:HD domain-containing protein [Dehalococcoidales bacterium]
MKDTNLAVRPDAFRLLAEISRFFSERGIQAFVVGGFVRDTLQGRVTADIDIAVDADAVRLAPDIAAVLGGKPVTLDADNRISRIVLPEREWEIDVTSFSGDIRDDLARRDFTINAMAYQLDESIESGIDPVRIIDPFNGRDDMGRGIVRAVSDTAFADDPARLLRAVRIAGELAFSIYPGTEDMIRRDSRLITAVAGERDREELLRLLALPGAGEHLFRLDRLGLLTGLIPELGPARGTGQPLIHVWDVLEHSIRTVTAVEFALREGTWDYAAEDILSTVPWSGQLAAHFDEPVSSGSTRRVMLKLATLLHDIAKPQTKTLGDDGRARFLGHPNEGADVAAAILERLRFSRRETHLVELLVKYHMRPTQMSHEGLPTSRAIYRFFRDTGEAGTDILFLCLADHLATRGDTLDRDEWENHAAMTAFILAEHDEKTSISMPPKLIDGNEIIQQFGIEPGPQVGRILEALREAQAAGEVTDKKQAADYINQMITGSSRADADEPLQGEL